MTVRRLLALLLAATAALLGSPTALAQPALWVVRDADTTIHLFGTMHMLPAGVAWFEDDARAAFERSDTLVLEMVSPSPDDLRGAVLRRALRPRGPPMAARLPVPARAPYADALDAIGAPPDAFDPFHTWFAALTLTSAAAERAGYASERAPEHVLAAAARAAGKTVVGLETLDEQLGIFASMPEPLQVRLLASTVAQLPDTAGVFARMLDAWRSGATDRLAAVMAEGFRDLPEAEERVMLRRNARWARWVAARLRTPGTVFVAVGAGHLAGPGDLVAALATMGLRAERVGR